MAVPYPWSPSQSSNQGFWPTLSPDGLWVAYGVWHTWIASLDTGLETEIPMQHGGLGSYPHGWYDTNKVLVTEILNDTAPNWARVVYTVTVPSMAITDIPADQGLAAGNQVRADRLHWATWYDADGKVSYDGTQLTNPDTGLPLNQCHGVRLSEGWLLTTKADQGYPIWQYHNGARVAVRTPLTDMNEYCACDGWIAYGLPGMHVIAPDGTDTDNHVVPWGNEYSPFLMWVGGTLWLWTFAESPTEGPLVLGREVGNTSVIACPTPDPISVFVRAVGSTFLIAGHNNVGHLTVFDVPQAAARRTFIGAGAPGYEWTATRVPRRLAAPRTRKNYPHVPQVQDRAAKDALRVIFDRLATVEGTVKTQGQTVATLGTSQADVSKTVEELGFNLDSLAIPPIIPPEE